MLLVREIMRNYEYFIPLFVSNVLMTLLVILAIFYAQTPSDQILLSCGALAHFVVDWAMV